MYKRILVPLDGSPSSEVVFPHILPLAQTFDAELILLQVILEPAKEFSVPISPLSPPKEIRKIQTKSKAYLKKICAKLERDGTRTSYLIRQGGISESILEVAETMQADLITMSTHGHSKTRLFLLGSVTYQVVRHAPLPVLVIRSKSLDGQNALES
jgi:nucleotide-binding universal stress UspA family protein